MEAKIQLYKQFLEKTSLDIKTIKQMGFSFLDVIIMCIRKELKREGNMYTLVDPQAYYRLAQSFSQEKNYYMTNICFQKCAELDPLHREANLRLFYFYLTTNNFLGSLKYLNVLNKTDDPHDRADYLFYLFMLGFLVDLPTEYKRELSNLPKKSIMIPEGSPRYSDLEKYDAFRIQCYKQEFFKAHNTFTSMFKEEYSVDYLISEKLLYLARSASKRKKRIISDLVHAGNYDELLNLFTMEKGTHQLRMVDQAYYHLCKIIISMRDKKIVPSPSEKCIDNLFYNILHNHLETAYADNMAFAQKNNIPKNKNVMGIMLRQAILYKHQLTIENPNDSVFSHFIINLYDRKYDACYRWIKKLGLEDYLYLIKALISLCNIEEDKLFSRAIITSSELLRNQFTFDTTKYLEEAAAYLAEGKLKEANLMIKIVSKASQNGHADLSSDEVINMLKAFKTEQSEISESIQKIIQMNSSTTDSE